jgi:hypothetical protein
LYLSHQADTFLSGLHLLSCLSLSSPLVFPNQGFFFCLFIWVSLISILPSIQGRSKSFAGRPLRVASYEYALRAELIGYRWLIFLDTPLFLIPSSLWRTSDSQLDLEHPISTSLHLRRRHL